MLFEKTVVNDADPDGGIAFGNTGSDGLFESSLVIRGNGNAGMVGIGTTTPSAGSTLHVLYSDPNSSGTPGSDSFRIQYDNDFFGANVDPLVIEKTDANDLSPDVPWYSLIPAWMVL